MSKTKIEKARTKANKSINKLQRLKENMKDIKIDKAEELKRQKNPFQKDKKKFYKFPFSSRRKLRVAPMSTYLITMYFQNGTMKTFSMTKTENTFDFRKKTYFLYYEEAWYDLSMSQYHLFYFEGFTVPINREVQQIGEEAFFNVKPDNLKNLIKFEYVKVLAGAHSFDKLLKVIILLVAVNILATAIIGFMQYSGGAK